MVEETAALAPLHAGVPVPEYDTCVPWLITEQELFRYIPADEFTVSGGGWAMLDFTLLGFRARYGFDFVTRPEKLSAVVFENEDEGSIDETFARSSRVLRERLGAPNFVDRPEWSHLWWRDKRVWVENVISDGYDVLLDREVTSHRLSLVAAFAYSGKA